MVSTTKHVVHKENARFRRYSNVLQHKLQKEQKWSKNCSKNTLLTKFWPKKPKELLINKYTQLTQVVQHMIQ